MINDVITRSLYNCEGSEMGLHGPNPVIPLSFIFPLPLGPLWTGLSNQITTSYKKSIPIFSSIICESLTKLALYGAILKLR